MCAHRAVLFGFIAALATAATVGFDSRDVAAAGPKKKPTDTELRLKAGAELFTRRWVPQPPPSATAARSMTKAGDGLGPMFNERSCAGCHKQGGLGGGGPSENNVQIVNVGPLPGLDEESRERQARSLFPEHEGFSMVLHRFSVAPGYDAWRRSRLLMATTPPNAVGPRSADVELIRYRLLRDEGEQVRFTVASAGGRSLPMGRVVAQGPPLAPLSLEERNTTALFGAGLLDAIPEQVIREGVEKQPKAQRGRPAVLPDGRLGRFGWKAQNVSLADFNENACAVELGLETPVRHQAKAPNFAWTPTYNPDRYNESPGLDMTTNDVAALTFFTSSLPRPEKRPSRGAEGAAELGERLFTSIGCAVCHTSELGDVAGIYSDLLLHRMGSFGSVYYASTATPADIVETSPPRTDEFRTPPLWGVADSPPYMHDGSAKTLRDAIVAHGIQGDDANRMFLALGNEDQVRVLAFLESLRAPATR